MLGLDFERKIDGERIRAKELADADCREYFCHIASDFYVGKMIGMFDKFEDELLREAVRYPFKNTIKVPVSMMVTYWCENYQDQMKREDDNWFATQGSVFMSPSGWTRRNIYRIFRETEFQSRVIKRLGLSDRFFLSLSSDILFSDSKNRTYDTTLWLNFRMN